MHIRSIVIGMCMRIRISHGIYSSPITSISIIDDMIRCNRRIVIMLIQFIIGVMITRIIGIMLIHIHSYIDVNRILTMASHNPITCVSVYTISIIIISRANIIMLSRIISVIFIDNVRVNVSSVTV